MDYMNRFTIIGRLTKDPEVRTLENGNKVTNVTVAVDRNYKTKEGEKITDFLPFTLWNKDAENIANISKKGAVICLEGYNTIKKKDNSYTFNPIVTSYKHIANKHYSVEDSVSNELDEGKEVTA